MAPSSNGLISVSAALCSSCVSSVICAAPSLLLVLLFAAKPSFSVASSASPAPTNPIKPATNNHHILLVLLSISAAFLLLSLLLLMAYFLCFRVGKSRRGIHRDQVLPAQDPEAAGERSESVDFGTDLAARFPWEEIEKLGRNFSRVVGEGGYSTVYLVRFSDSSLGALKICRSSERLNQVFRQELQVLSQISHKNIVRLLGFCDEREEGVLVLEYICNGTLHEKLHSRGTPPLPWARRMSIAFQLAQAIDYLHESCSLQIVHCDIKASNVLLDEQLSCKLCDFGSAKMGFSSTILPSSANPVTGSPGYADPHYLRTGIISKKTDVYSFGVLVLEMITGMEAFCEEKGQLLTSVLRPTLKTPGEMVEMVDPGLKGAFDREEATAMAAIAAACLSEQPSLRPSMGEILTTMEEKLAGVDFVAGSCSPKR